MRPLVSRILPPLSLAVLVIGAWHGLVVLGDIPPFLLPSPLRVASAFWTNATPLLLAARYTSLAALTGLTASVVVGLGVAIVFSQSAAIRRSSYPYAIYLQTTPIVAIAPLLATWIGEGFWAIVVVAFIISLFPIITNATDGLLSVSMELDEVFRLYGATRWQRLWRLQFPGALPRIVTGIKTAGAMVVLGATVGEYFVGEAKDEFGLGNVILKSIQQLHIDKLFATTLLCTLLSVTIFTTVSAVGARLVHWHDSL